MVKNKKVKNKKDKEIFIIIFILILGNYFELIVEYDITQIKQIINQNHET